MSDHAPEPMAPRYALVHADAPTEPVVVLGEPMEGRAVAPLYRRFAALTGLDGEERRRFGFTVVRLERLEGPEGSFVRALRATGQPRLGERGPLGQSPLSEAA